jgi:hypothetical protein
VNQRVVSSRTVSDVNKPIRPYGAARSLTPIYDQLCVELLNGDVPVSDDNAAPAPEFMRRIRRIYCAADQIRQEAEF